MIEFTKSEIDDIDFISKVQILTNQIIKDLNPNEVYLFKVNNWFDTKWLNFTGKILGALGTWNYDDDSRIPPFSPNRIIEQGYYELNELKTYDKQKSNLQIHKKQSAENNLNRRIIDFSDSAVFVWYSSNTKKNGQGSLMVYPVENEKCQPFYIGLRKNKDWDIINAPGTNKKMLESYLERNKTPYNNGYKA